MKVLCRHTARVTFSAVALVALTACGGAGSPPPSVSGTGSGGTGSTPPSSSPIEYSVGGMVSGLVGQGLTLRILNPANTAHHTVSLGLVQINDNGVYRTGRVSDGYGVQVQYQPHSPTQRCVVRNGWGSYLLGPMPPNVTDVDVVCGEFSYVTNAADNTISAFAVDATTGAIASVGPSVTAGASPYAIASTSDKKYLYVGNSGSNDVSVFTVDAGSGALTALPGSPIAAGTSPRALSPYTAVTQSYGPPVIEFYLYVANAGSDNVSAYRVAQSTGVPTPLSPASYATGTGPSAMAIDPGGPFLYTANTGGSNDISAFLIDNFTGGLTPIAGSPYLSGNSVSSLAFGAGGKFLYAADASGGAEAIYAFSVDPDGVLTSLPGFPYSLPSCNFIAVDQTGNYLYATATTDLLGYSIDGQTGALSPLTGFPIAVGANADSVSIDPTNQFLYVRNGSAGTVTGFRLNAGTGALTPMLGSPFAVGTSADFLATF